MTSAAPALGGGRGRHAAGRDGDNRDTKYGHGAPEAIERDFRPDIQGLRALAVGLVVYYHLYPTQLSGGYVGVDVFFAISGYLITSHLVRTLGRKGRVSLLDFYGRRARRLMPAAVLVLTVTWIVARFVQPSTLLPATAEQVRASALYFQNWVLARQAVDYSASDAAPSPVQHFWSLSVEEQFYLVWPLIFLIAGLVLWLQRRRRSTATETSAASGDSTARPAGSGRMVLGVLALAIFVASLLYSRHLTATDQSAAYFVTTTRMWELALGGLLAILAERYQQLLGRLGPLAWVGLVMVGASAYLMSAKTNFPGTIALVPVGGAVLLLCCGSRIGRFGTFRLMSLPVLVFLGDISYSLYLWHYPIITLWQDYSGHKVGVRSGPAIVVVAILLSWLTKKYVEDAVRLSPKFAGHQLRSIATVLVAAVPVVLVTVFIAGESVAGAIHLDSKHPGAAVLAGTVKNVPKASPIPTFEEAPHNFGAYGKGPGGCQTDQRDSNLTECVFGQKTNPVKTIALVGDSVAGEWFGPIEKLAVQHHWKLVTDLHSECPWTATMAAKPPANAGPYTTCQQWGKNVLSALINRIKPDLVITSARPSVGSLAHPTPGTAAFRDLGIGMATYWKKLQAHHIPVAAIQESPEMPFDVPDCLSKPGQNPSKCSAPASKAVLKHTPIEVAKSLDPAAALIDLNPYICSPTTCNPIVGNVVVYIDTHHITNTYAMTVGPFIWDRLKKLPAIAG